MKPARTYPPRRDDVRLLVVDADGAGDHPSGAPGGPVKAGAVCETRTSRLPELLAPGDLLIVNDAATLPASLRGQDAAGHPVEVRLVSTDVERGDGHFWAVLFGEGDWHQRTEDRPPPTALAPGARLDLGAVEAEVVAISPLSPRLACLRFARDPDALWTALYRSGRPVQYSHLAHDLPLWAVQTVYADRPWAFEMPSAGRPLSWEILLALRRKGVGWASLTHAAGLSATGDPALDAALPLPERYEIPAATVAAITETHRRGGRVIAVGTTVVRALEGAFASAGAVRAGPGVTDLRIGPDHRLRVVDGILSGIHTSAESHFALLGAFAAPELLRAAEAYADAHDFTTHELGDAMLVLGRNGRNRAARAA